MSPIKLSIANTLVYWLLHFATLPIQAQVDIGVIDTKTVITTTNMKVVESTIVDKNGTVIGDPVTIEQNETSNTKDGPLATLLTVETEAANVQLEVTDIKRLPVPFRQLDGHKYLLQSNDKQWVDILVVDFQKNIFFRKTVVVEAKIPTPQPDPDPSPTPTPTPDPTPAPIDGPGFRVLFISESGDNMPQNLGAIFFDREIQDWLNANCVKVDGQPDFRRVDPDTKFTDPNHRFAKALTRPRNSLPWLIASNGTTNVGFEGPFPTSKDNLWAILKRVQSASPNQSESVQSPIKITMFTTDGCEPCKRFIVDELPKFKTYDPNIKFGTQKGGATIYPAFKIEVGTNTNFILGFTTAEAIFKTIEALK